MAEKVKVTIGEANKKLSMINALDLSVNDKLSHAGKRCIDRITSAMRPLAKVHQEKIDDINISHAATDEKGNLIVDAKGNYSYKPEAEKKRRKEMNAAKDAYENQEIEFEPFFAQDCLRMIELDLFLVEELTGILFQPVTDAVIKP